MEQTESAVRPIREKPNRRLPEIRRSDQARVDQCLMARVKAGDQIAFGELVDRYWPSLVNYAARLVGRGIDAEDVAQETFIRVWRSRSEWSPSGAVSSYLYRIARNLALNAQRDHAAELRRREHGDEIAGFAGSSPDPHKDLEVALLRDEVRAALELLPRRRREVFVLSRFHGLSYGEIAGAMEIAPQTVANQMTAALAELRRLLSHHLEDSA